MTASAARAWDERTARAAWSRLAEPGDEAAHALIDQHGALEATDLVLGGGDGSHLAWAPRHAALLRTGLERWRTRLPDLEPRRDLEVLAALGGRLVVPGDQEWPCGLDDLGAAVPTCLWVRGPADLAAACEGSLALVGSRASTGYGERVAAETSAAVAARGTTVVSGGAYGIDGAAHRAALGVEGTTVAVLAGGVDRAYPAGHTSLLGAIAATGAVVSETPPGCAPTRWRFLARNRLIAAMSAATVVVEAAWRSGALSTAAHAAGLNRPVGAVPGPVTSSSSAGCHRLVRDGRAILVSDPAEVFELLDAVGTPQAPSAAQAAARVADHDGLDPDVSRVHDVLPLRVGAEVERLVREAGLPQRTVAAALGTLSLRGLAQRCEPGERWRRAPRRR